MAILEVKDLNVSFHTKKQSINALEDVSFSIDEGEVLCIVGESGSGKSVTSLSIMGLLPSDISRIDNGEVLFKNENLIKKTDKEMKKIRGNTLSMIFQEPMTSLNPVFTVGDQVSEVYRYHLKKNKKEAKLLTIEAFKNVGLPSPEKQFDRYPHQLSGGMRQRIMIAMALVCSPKLLIADEPTTALDVTIQAQVLDIMRDLKNNLNTSILFITHDLGVVSDIADKVVVMYAGYVVEIAQSEDIFNQPLHPYTKSLLESTPSLDGENVDNDNRLKTIPGGLPEPDNRPKGCRFNPRCPFATEKCREQEPKLQEVENGRKVACWHYEKLKQPT